MTSLSRLLRRFDLTLGSAGFVTLLWLFFALFLAYPLTLVFVRAFFVEGRFTLRFIGLMFTDAVYRDCIINSINLGFAATVLTSLLAVPTAVLMTRYRFPGKAILAPLLLVPLIMPPFVGPSASVSSWLGSGL